jgi:hypothetical protein
MPTPINYSEEHEIKSGAEIARILQLKPARDDQHKRYKPERYETTHGTKTALGLFRTLEQFYTHRTEAEKA